MKIAPYVLAGLQQLSGGTWSEAGWFLRGYGALIVMDRSESSVPTLGDDKALHKNRLVLHKERLVLLHS